jgi:glucose/arabinose dehydrogenase
VGLCGRALLLAASLAVALACGSLAAALARSALVGREAVLTVRLDARDFSFKLSRRSVPAGSTVRFVVHNRGQTLHDFVVKGRRTRQLRPGGTQTITVNFPHKGSYRFLCSVSGHARLGMKGAFAVGKPPAPAPKPPAPVTVSGTAVLTRIGTFEQPVLVTAPPGDDRIFVVEQTGRVRIVRDGAILPQPFLDLRERVTASGESGLLSIAFAPDYAQSGRLYGFYNMQRGYGDIRIAEFRAHSTDPDVVDPSQERALLTIPKPYENHNGGMLQFGSDGYLYASVGDGDPGVLNPAGYFAQRLDVLLGSIVRIDPRSGDPYAVPRSNPFVDIAGARPEIWAYGLRNPWRFWIDRETGETFIGDVGSTSREEIDFVPRNASGRNFGWPCFEGTLVFDAGSICDRPVYPLIDFPRENGVCAVIGGVVVRDARLAALAGRYLYGDLCTGQITALVVEGGRVRASEPLGLVVPGLSSFGVDGVGHVYVTSLEGGVYRLDPTSS